MGSFSTSLALGYHAIRFRSTAGFAGERTRLAWWPGTPARWDDGSLREQPSSRPMRVTTHGTSTPPHAQTDPDGMLRSDAAREG